MTKEDDLVHRWADERREGGAVFALKEENDALKAANAALEKEKLKLKNRITQLETIITDLKAAALKRKR
jgi:hypothetical protein